jgi:hypothetical protein
MRGLATLLGCVLLAGCAAMPDAGPVAEPGDPEAGTLTFENGRDLQIRPDALRFTGVARFRWPDGRVYSGSFAAGRPSGQGVETRPDGSRYEGEFVDGKRAGRGTFSSGAGRYDGDWQDDAPHGRGRFEYADGSRYAGGWANGRRSGSGLYERDDGSGYDGDWQDDLPNGFGVMTDTRGSRYEGAFAAGQRSGYGALDFGEGIGYAGMWLDNRRHGFGRETRPDGGVYEGEWQNDRQHGTAIDRRGDGSFHEGAFENGRPLGPGRRRSAEGTEISGLWNDNSVASGVVSLPDGAEFGGALYRTATRSVHPEFRAWLEAQAAAGSAQAALLLGDAYRLFESPPRDLDAAARWYSLAAERGSGEAAFRLAEVMAERDGPTPAMLAALERAAALDHGAANARLGAFHQVGNLLPKDHARARRYYETALRAGDLDARNNLAWLLATSPDDGIRDGALAVRLVRPLALLYDHWTYVDTLAAACAEAGDFAAARAAAKRALSLAAGEAPPETQEALRARLAAFGAGKPYREP